MVSIHNAKDKTVRHRVCQLIAGIMTVLQEDFAISDDLWDALQAALLMRCRDKIACVRAAAATAMLRLQVRLTPPASPAHTSPSCYRLHCSSPSSS